MQRQKASEGKPDDRDPAAGQAHLVERVLDGVGPVGPSGSVEVLDARAVAREPDAVDRKSRTRNLAAEIAHVVRRPCESVNADDTERGVSVEIERLGQGHAR
jgi:hypothetical protein